MSEIVDLRDAPELLEGYVALRNRHAELLLTEPVTAEETRRWLAESPVQVRLLREGGRVLGAAVLYPQRGAEVAVFVDEPGHGTGPALLLAIEEASRGLGATEIRAVVRYDNLRARRAFLKAGFEDAGGFTRLYRGAEVTLNAYRKTLGAPPAPGGAVHTEEAYGLRPEAAAFPMMCVIAFVYVCNARCPSCPYTNSDIRASYRDMPLMKPETFRIIADQCGPHGAWIRVSGGGEPLLHPDALELFEYATRAGAKVGLITNGSRLDAEAARRLLEAGVDMVEFSVDAADPETYGRVRPGLDWATLLANVERLVAERDRLRAPTKIIASGVNQVGVDIDAVARFWERRVDIFQRRKFLTWGINDPSRSADPAPYLPPEQRVPCPFIFERLNIDSRGTVMVCGFDIAGRTDLGNVHKAPIAEIWHGEGFERYRRLHLQRRGHEIELCRDCPDWQYRSWRHNYWKIVRTAEERRRGKADALGLQDIEGSPAEAPPEK
ncbi:MAG TPA: GNAT family N-acetyltransferase [bacterium]